MVNCWCCALGQPSGTVSLTTGGCQWSTFAPEVKAKNTNTSRVLAVDCCSSHTHQRAYTHTQHTHTHLHTYTHTHTHIKHTHILSLSLSLSVCLSVCLAVCLSFSLFLSHLFTYMPLSTKQCNAAQHNAMQFYSQRRKQKVFYRRR